MSDWQLQTPVAFFIFNRPSTTVRVFEAISQVRPSRLLVVADGPRSDHPSDAKKCTAARSFINRIDWDCELVTNFAESNMGCKRRVSSGLDWVFEIVEEAIILEDDCLPHLTFFRFCEELLERYEEDERIMCISGDNFQFGQQRTGDSYYFSRYPHCWGWATWRRAWQHYDGDMTQWPTVRAGGWLQSILPEKHAMRYWTRIFDRTYQGQVDSWAYSWTYSCWIQSGLSVLPNVNLVSNIGFGEQGSHTKSDSRFAEMATGAIEFPLRHPPLTIRNAQADRFTQLTHYGTAFHARIFRGALRIAQWLKEAVL